MNLNAMISELVSEREQIDAAIMSLERIARGRGKRRGRPPKWMSNAAAEPKKHTLSAETKRKMAEAQRKRWEKRKKAQEK